MSRSVGRQSGCRETAQEQTAAKHGSQKWDNKSMWVQPRSASVKRRLPREERPLCVCLCAHAHVCVCKTKVHFHVCGGFIQAKKQRKKGGTRQSRLEWCSYERAGVRTCVHAGLWTLDQKVTWKHFSQCLQVSVQLHSVWPRTKKKTREK